VLADPLGSGVAVVDEDGLLLHQTRFKPFGAPDGNPYHAPNTANEPQLRRLFAGHSEQKETQLTYMNARWHDPETGIFLSVDPVAASASDPQSLNGYAYARNNPVNLTDPNGMCVSIFLCGMVTTGGSWVTNARTTATTSTLQITIGGVQTGAGTLTEIAVNRQSLGLVDGAVTATAAAQGFSQAMGGSGGLASFGNVVGGVVGLIIGQNFGAAWMNALFGPWIPGPWTTMVPKSVQGTLNDVRATTNQIAPDAKDNGMKAWHAGSNAALAQQFGLIAAPLIIALGLYHESPFDFGSFQAEQGQGSVNHLLDSIGDIGANVFGLGIGYALPRGTAISAAIFLGNYIPGPGDNALDMGGTGTYAGHPSAAWSTGPQYR
jgi:RHS repeat-associated protein